MALVSIVLFFSFSGCGSQTNDVNLQQFSHESYGVNVLDSVVKTDFGLAYLNNMRESAGLNPFRLNSYLQKSALSHARYLVDYNLYSHYEENYGRYFTGRTPLARAKESGYTNENVLENIYAGDVNPQESIDILFSNIYHRFAFLNLSSDEVGIGTAESDAYHYQKVYAYEMGSSRGTSLIQQENPKVLFWPYVNQKDVLPVFYEELPDPLSQCSVSGYPVSIEFNPEKNGNITLKSFTLIEEESQKVLDTIFMDKETDPNAIFNKNQFALFPVKRLDWGKKYKAEVVYYEEDGTLLHKAWSFQTKALSGLNFTVSEGKNHFSMPSGTNAFFYVPPKDCNDLFKSYSYSYSDTLKLEERMVDNNTIMLKAKGTGSITIVTDNAEEFTVNVY
jgi:hypothetical protein